MIDLLESLEQSLIDNPGEPYCAACWGLTSPLELNDDGDLECPYCELVIEVKGVE